MASDARFRFLLEPGTENCFYEDVRKIGNFIEYSYKVEKGGASGLQFVIKDPAKNIVLEDKTKLKVVKKKFLSKSWGTYEFCFRHILPYFPEKKIEFLYTSVEDPEMEPLTYEQRNPIAPGSMEAAAEYMGVEDQLTKVELALARSYGNLQGLWVGLDEEKVVMDQVDRSLNMGLGLVLGVTLMVGIAHVMLMEKWVVGEMANQLPTKNA